MAKSQKSNDGLQGVHRREILIKSKSLLRAEKWNT